MHLCDNTVSVMFRAFNDEEGGMQKVILIVEDDVLCVKLFEVVLQSHGFKTISTDGTDTIKLAKEHHPDLILMDIRLPGASGIEHTKVLKAADGLKNIPIVATTSFSMKGDREKFLTAGCDGYISKPINIHQFLDVIRNFITVERFRLIPSVEVGHDIIDAEHEQIVMLANEFFDCIDEGGNKNCSGKIDELTTALYRHLENEEQIMEELGYYHLGAHKTEHIAATIEYEALLSYAECNGYGNDFANRLTSLLADFIVRSDMGFKMFLEKLNQEQTLPTAPKYHHHL